MPLVSTAPENQFLRDLRADIAALPQGVVEIAAALVAVQFALPQTLVDWLIAEMGLRANLNSVSPVALACMKIGGVANFIHQGTIPIDLESEYALLSALCKEAHLNAAAKFLDRLVQRLAEFAPPSHVMPAR